jgi:hypothetical protein
MANKKFLLGTLALALVLMLAVTGCNTLQSVTLSKGPSKTIYGQGQPLDTSGLEVIGNYKKDSKPVQASTSGYDSNTPGQKTVRVIFEGKTAPETFTVTVVPVEKMTIEQPPTTTGYMQGDEFDPAGLAVKVEFEGGAVPPETVGPQNPSLKLSGYNKDSGGVQTITADYYGKKATFEVKTAALTKIAVTNPPDNTLYFTGEDIDLAGIVVTGTWEGAGEKPVTVTAKDLSSFDKYRAGKQSVVVTYYGKTASFPVEFVAMQALTVTQQPGKLNYENGEELDLSGLSVQGTRQGQNTIEMLDTSRFQVSGYDRFKGGNQTITLTLGGKTTTFRVTVAPSPFLGTWHGTVYDRVDGGGRRHNVNDGRGPSDTERPAPVTFVITEDSWSLVIPKTENFNGVTEYSGTYTRDTDTGKTVKLVAKKAGQYNNLRSAPTAAEITSYGLRLTGGTFDVTLSK